MPNPGPTPRALIVACPEMGPPVFAELSARAASVRGSNSPTLLLAGRASPFSQTTPSGSTSQIFAARLRSSSTTFFAASTTAMPTENVTRLPPVMSLYGMELVSGTMGRTRS